MIEQRIWNYTPLIGKIYAYKAVRLWLRLQCAPVQGRDQISCEIEQYSNTSRRRSPRWRASIISRALPEVKVSILRFWSSRKKTLFKDERDIGSRTEFTIPSLERSKNWQRLFSQYKLRSRLHQYQPRSTHHILRYNETFFSGAICQIILKEYTYIETSFR